MKTLLFIPGISDNTECLIKFTGGIAYFAFLIWIFLDPRPRYQIFCFVLVCGEVLAVGAANFFLYGWEIDKLVFFALAWILLALVLFMRRAPQRRLYKIDQDYKKKNHPPK